ncbi:hypothetical protein Glove_229g48 [Diversispora epigaea]|uniref:Uncharacterized protein n=1 Tax=Diversispora epigaea TaxID=1348612 RepID=A0A397IHR7_9GLOM|nr:hypothetical protein Glove_229g48 [Diversispora epigaea]
MSILILIYFSSISKLRELDYINEEEVKPYEIKNLVRFAPKQSVKSIILPSRTNLVQELPTHTTEQTKPLFPIIMCEHEISSWYCNGTKINGIDETLRGYNTLAWNSNTVEEKLVKPYEIKNLVRFAPKQSVKSIILPSRTNLVQELPTHTTEQTKPLFPIIMCEHEISSWYCNGTKINGIDETLRGYNTLAWNSNTVEEKLVIALFSHC